MGRQIRLVLTILALLSLVEIVNILTNRSLTLWGIFPRDWVGARGIIFAPFIHGSFWHFSANILPMAIFSWLLLQYGLRRFVLVNLLVIVGSGLSVWLIGRSAMHVGASGLIYGYFGFLLLAGVLSGRVKLLVISLLVGVLYGGLIFGVLPSNPYVSWESHLFGFIFGLLAAKIWARQHT